MIFDIEHIYEEGLDFELRESKEHFSIDGCTLTEDIKIQGRLEKIGPEILCQGRVQTGLHVTCARCLKDFNFTVNGKLKAHFIPRVEDNNLPDEIELTDLDVEQEYYDEGQIDLSCPVRDLILLSLPQVALCREDCAGLCPECGANLNETNCGCEKEGSFDPRLAVLQQLKDKLK